jgi:hypothetical protein
VTETISGFPNVPPGRLDEVTEPVSFSLRHGAGLSWVDADAARIRALERTQAPSARASEDPRRPWKLFPPLVREGAPSGDGARPLEALDRCVEIGPASLQRAAGRSLRAIDRIV